MWLSSSRPLQNNPEDVLSYATISFKRNGADTVRCRRALNCPDEDLQSNLRGLILTSHASIMLIVPIAGPDKAGTLSAFIYPLTAICLSYKLKNNVRRTVVTLVQRCWWSFFVAIIFSKCSAVLQNVHHEDKVTYSTVRDVLLPSSSSSSAAHVDVYAQINKP